MLADNTILRASIMNNDAVSHGLQINDCDLPLLAEYRIVAVTGSSGVSRAVARSRHRPIKNIALGRLIMSAGDGDVVDHINGDPWDNRRMNLRVCRQRQNLQNARISKNHPVGFKGVNRVKNRYKASICVDGHSRFLGSFISAEDAARAYDAAARVSFGDFGRFNFPAFGEQSAMVEVSNA